MKNTKDAIRYGIETLNVSPDEMFSLIESSKGYDGDDYKRWLASKIIDIAEKDGVGYSQLLVKKFHIIQDMMNTSDLVMKKGWVDFFENKFGGSYTIDFPEVTSGIPFKEDVDWFNGIDFSADDSFFLKEELPDLYDKVVNGEQVSILARLSDTGAKKTSDLYQDANSRGIPCKSIGGLFLYRLCKILEAFDVQDNFSVGLLTDMDFVLDAENSKIWKYFLCYFNCTGYALSSSEVFENAIGSKRFAFIQCTPRVDLNLMDSLELREAKLVERELQLGSKKRYTRSETLLETWLAESLGEVETERLPRETREGVAEEESVENVKNALGFLNLNSLQGAWLSTLPANDFPESIPITTKNLDMVIIYFSVSFALKRLGINEQIVLPLTGSDSYRSLVCNCIPLFLFSTNSRFRGYPDWESVLCPGYKNFTKELLASGEVYYSFEAKELIDLCTKYLEGDNVVGEDGVRKCFEDIRSDSDCDMNLNSEYISRVRNLCDYIRGVYKEVI